MMDSTLLIRIAAGLAVAALLLGFAGSGHTSQNQSISRQLESTCLHHDSGMGSCPLATHCSTSCVALNADESGPLLQINTTLTASRVPPSFEPTSVLLQKPPPKFALPS